MRRLVPALLLLAWSAWLASAYLLSGEASYIRQHDTAEVNTPYYTALPSLRARHLAGLRDPLAGTGVDALSNLKGDMPLVEAFFHLSPHWSNSGVLLFAQTTVAGLGMFLLMRRRFGTGVVAALAAAGWFAFLPSVNVPYSGYPTWYGFYVPALPLALVGLTVRTRAAIQFGVATLIGGILALGTPAASGMLVIPVVALWMFTFGPGVSWRRTSGVVLCFSCAVLVVKLPTIIALLANAPESHRVVRAGLPFGVSSLYEFWLVRVAEAQELVGAYVVPLAVAVGGWAMGGFRRRPLNLALSAVVALILATLVAPLLQVLQGALGTVFRSYAVDRINRFMPLFAAVACALALDHLHQVRAGASTGTRGKQAAMVMYALATAILMLPLAALSVRMNSQRELYRQAGNRYDYFFRQPALEALGREAASGSLFRVVTFADRNANQYGQHAAFAWAYALETADVYGTTYPRRYHEFWRRVIEPVMAKRTDIRDYFDRWGNMAYLFNPAAVLFDPLPDGADTSPTPVPFNLALLSLANVRYVISRERLAAPQLRLREGQPPGLLVYENSEALPRFFMVHDWRGFASSGALLEAMASADASTLQMTAMIDEASASRLGSPSRERDTGAGPDTIVAIRYEADQIELRVHARKRGLLIASNSYSRHWVAAIDGRAAAMIPAYHTFQGIPVEPGDHTVTLSYRPPHGAGGLAQPLGVALGVAGLLGIGIVAGVRCDSN